MRLPRAALYVIATFALALGTASAVTGCGGGSKATKGAQDVKNPCGGNPCGGNPCGGNPCGGNPCGGNPCGGNPCGGAAKVDPATVTQPDGQALNAGGLSEAELLAKGEKLWNDASLSKAGTLSCASCHDDGGMFEAGFKAPYPHPVKMAKQRAGIDSINAAGMVQLCMVIPMKAKAYAWDSVDLAALTAKVHAEQKAFAAKK